MFSVTEIGKIENLHDTCLGFMRSSDFLEISREPPKSSPNNIDISSVLFTLNSSTRILNSKCKDGARYINIAWSRYSILSSKT